MILYIYRRGNQVHAVGSWHRSYTCCALSFHLIWCLPKAPLTLAFLQTTCLFIRELACVVLPEI